MSKKSKQRPWDFLQQFKGSHFTGEWPTVVEMFEITAERYPQNPCFQIFSPHPMLFNYTEALHAIKGVANYLLSIGVKSGDKVAVTGKNGPEWTIAYLGVLFAGAIVVPLDYALHDSEIETLIEFAGVKHVCIDAERIDRIDATGKLGLEKKISLEPGHTDYILDLLVEEELPRQKATEDDLAAILFTSGTTGTPKGVMLTHKNLVSDCYLAQDHMDIFSTDVFYAILPLHHAYTMLAVFIETISCGAKLVFGKKLVISQVFKDFREGGVTMFLSVPMMYNKMLSGLMSGVKEKGIVVYGLIRFLMSISGFIKKVFRVNPGKKMFGFLLKKMSLENMRICICGGGPLPSSTFKLFNQLGIDFVQGYGLSETSPIIALNPIYAYIETSVGKVVTGTEMKIINPDEKGIGEIVVRGPMVMKGYYNNPEATAEVLDADGWLKTGDLGYLDSENYLYLTGRAKNVIVSDGGKNVFPEEIEDMFQLFDEIEQILVTGYLVDEKMKSEGIRALIYPSDKFRDEMEAKYPGDKNKQQEETQATMEGIVRQVNKELQIYKRITKVTLVPEPMKMTSTKKIKRFIVADIYKDY